MASSDQDVINTLVNRVHQRMEMDEKYASEKDRGFSEKRRRRLLDLIVAVVQEFFGRMRSDYVSILRNIFYV